MSARLEDWSLYDHARFLGRASGWLLAAALVAGGLGYLAARQLTTTSASALLELGHNPVTGWIEPPNALLARLTAPGFLAGEANVPEGAPTLSAKQIPNSGIVRFWGDARERAVVEATMDAAIAKILREHAARAALAKTALARREKMLDREVARLEAVLALPPNDDPAVVVERMRVAQRLGAVEREREKLRPDVKISSPRTSRLVQPVAYRVQTRGPKRAAYGAFAGFLLALTLLYLREGLRRGGGASAE